MTEDSSTAAVSENLQEYLPANEDPAEDLSVLTPIQNRYVFWHRTNQKLARLHYNDSIKPIASFQTVERFWTIYDHLKRPSEFESAEFHLFKFGIRPFWEDEQNQAGGKWMIRLPKGIASRYWEDLVLAIIGEQFDVGSEICGAVISVRTNEDIVSVWNRTADNKEAVDKIRDQIRRFVKLPVVIPIEYKRHKNSLEEGSSYRNPTFVWRAPAKIHHNNISNNGYNGYNHASGEKDRERTGYYHRDRENTANSSSNSSNRDYSGQGFGREQNSDREKPERGSYSKHHNNNTTSNTNNGTNNNANDGGARPSWKSRWQNNSDNHQSGHEDGTGDSSGNTANSNSNERDREPRERRDFYSNNNAPAGSGSGWRRRDTSSAVAGGSYTRENRDRVGYRDRQQQQNQNNTGFNRENDGLGGPTATADTSSSNNTNNNAVSNLAPHSNSSTGTGTGPVKNAWTKPRTHSS